MRLSKSQDRQLAAAYEKLRRRDLVFLQGNSNGKTQILDMLRWKCSSKLGGKALDKSRTSEATKLELLEDIQRMPRADKLTSTYLMRQILRYYGEAANYQDMMEVEKMYRTLMISLNKANTIPVLALDNIEVYSKRHYTVMKELNEYRYHGKRLGIAIVISGDLVRSKMPMPFYEKCTEISIDRIQSSTELRDILAMWFPLDMGLFTPQIVQSFDRCDSLQQVIKAANIMVDKWHEVSVSEDDELTIEMATSAVSKAKRLVKLAA